MEPPGPAFGRPDDKLSVIRERCLSVALPAPDYALRAPSGLPTASSTPNHRPIDDPPPKRSSAGLEDPCRIGTAFNPGMTASPASSTSPRAGRRPTSSSATGAG